MYIIVAGAGLIGYQVTKELVQNKHDVVVIDKESDVCESIYSETGAIAICGSATDVGILKKAGADKADTILCLMRAPADNIACSLLAKSLKIPRIIARLRNPQYEDAYHLAGVTTIVRMADLLVNQIMMEVEQPKVKKIMTLPSGKAEIYAVTIPPHARVANMTISHLTRDRGFPSECVFTGIYKAQQEEFLIPRGNYTFQEKDTVFLVCKSQVIKQASDFLTKN